MTTNRRFSGRTHVTMTPELQQKLQEYAQKMQTQQTSIIRQALLEYFERHSLHTVEQQKTV